MSEEKKSRTEYASNSHKSKDAVEPVKKKHVEKVIEGTATLKKKSLGTKIREQFTGDDAQSVGNYILFDVILPAAKNMLSDAVSQGIDRILFGGSRPSSGHSSRLVSRTGYNKMYRGDATSDRRELSGRARATHDFAEVRLESRDEAESILNGLDNLISEFGVATVGDLYDLAGITVDFTNEKWGWTDLRGAGIRRGRDGYFIDLPRPIVLD